MSRGPWQREPEDLSGQTFGVWQVIERTTPWEGKHDTLYRVRFTCCGREGQKTHSSLQHQKSLRAPAERCRDCQREAERAAVERAERRRTERPVEANAAELASFSERKEQEARERAQRIAARRAEWERRTQEAHRWRMAQP